jgi:AcrR family transcriptional regulator
MTGRRSGRSPRRHPRRRVTRARDGRRDRKKARTRRDLIEHAVALFESKGFDATTLEDIAAAADYAPRSFFRHFGSKEAVAFHDLPERFADFQAQLDPAPEHADPWQAIADALIENTERFAGGDITEMVARSVHLLGSGLRRH